MSEILQPTGTTAVDKVNAEKLFFTNGSTRMLHTANASAFNASDIFSIAATTVKYMGGQDITGSGTTLQALTVPGTTTLTSVTGATLNASNSVSTNTLEAANALTDTLVVDAKVLRLNADVQVAGRLDVLNTTSMLVNDKIIKMGAIDANGDEIEDANDLSRDGASIVVPGPPQFLPADKDAEKYEHSVKWKVHSGDFNSDGSQVAPHLKPMFEFNGGAISIASPDASNRMARFVFAPNFTPTAATLGLYYAVGSDAYLVQSFSTTPFSVVN